jgi:hypothetical protein
MATTKKVAPKKTEETLTEKIGHVIADAKDSIVETFQNIVHPDKKKAAKKTASKPVKKTPAKPAAKPSAKKTAKKTAPAKTAKKTTRKK